MHNTREQYEKMLTEGTNCYFDSDDLLELSYDYFEEMEFDKSMAVAQYAIALHPSNEYLSMQKARCMLHMDAYTTDDVTRVLDSVTEHNIEYYLLKAEVELACYSPEKAQSYFIKAIQDKDCVLEDCIEIIDIYVEYNRLDCILDLLPTIEARFDDLTLFYRELATSFVENGNIEQAEAYYNKVLNINPYSVDDWALLASIYCDDCKFDEALEACDFALAIEEKNENALIVKGCCYHYKQDYHGAIKLFEELLSITAKKDLVCKLMADSYEQLGDFHAAIRCLEKAIELNVYEPSYYYFLASDYAYLNDSDKAIEVLKKVLDIDTENAHSRMLLGKLLLHTHNYEEAYFHYKQIDIDELCLMEHDMNFINVCLQLKYYDEIIEFLLNIIEKGSQNKLKYVFALIYTYIQAGNNKEALHWIFQVENENLMENSDEKDRQIWSTIKEQMDNI